MDCWFAPIPAGREIMIAREKPRAMVTNNALIFLLEKFLTALVKAPKCSTITNVLHLVQKNEDSKQSIPASLHPDIGQRFEIVHCCHLSARLQCLVKNRGLLNCFSELDPILSLVQTCAFIGYDNRNSKEWLLPKSERARFGVGGFELGHYFLFI
jgi:hypothetical protein